ncbi:hypothetical protein TNCV_3237221 [Trichonephila clavipes]|nr:hypothetical protein TNCV_3237221 [Trichonephila clavipes]
MLLYAFKCPTEWFSWFVAKPQLLKLRVRPQTKSVDFHDTEIISGHNSERGPRNSSWHGQEVRLSLALSTIQVTVRFKLGETPRRDDRWRHDLYLHLHNFCK